jgi:starvation-inducible outer membrane lipoprotein
LLPETYRGQTVTTEGTLRLSGEGKYEVVDADNQSVTIVGYEELALQAMLDQTVIVTGRFDIDETLGVYIDADSIGFAE